MLNNLPTSRKVDKEKFQVFVCYSPAPIPVCFAKHVFFVTNEKGLCQRWETTMLRPHNGHIHKNLFPLFAGINALPVTHRFLWKSTIFAIIEGKTAEKLIRVIAQSPTTYPYNMKYRITGPNSNTYAQWILNQVPEVQLTLPRGSFGKEYKQ